jgi:hypothetical protein
MARFAGCCIRRGNTPSRPLSPRPRHRHPPEGRRIQNSQTHTIHHLGHYFESSSQAHAKGGAAVALRALLQQATARCRVEAASRRLSGVAILRGGLGPSGGKLVCYCSAMACSIDVCRTLKRELQNLEFSLLGCVCESQTFTSWRSHRVVSGGLGERRRILPVFQRPCGCLSPKHGRDGHATTPRSS